VTATAPTAPLTPWVDAARPAPIPEGPPSYRDGPGRLRIDPRVIPKLAAQAANEVDGVTGASVAPVARAVHHPVPASTPPDQLTLDLDLTVTIAYPRPVRATAEHLAGHVARRVEELAGRRVRDLRVHVEHLRPRRDRLG